MKELKFPSKTDVSERCSYRSRKKLLRLFSVLVFGMGASVGVHAQPAAPYQERPTYEDEMGEENQMEPMGYYFSVGALGDMALTGYDGGLTERNTRVAYQLEIGSRSFAFPVSYSTGQGVNILGFKPRMQYLFPFGSGMISAGGGFGVVYNYWNSSPEIDSDVYSVSVHELGVQPSVKILFRPTPMMHVMVTPVALDLNFWRHRRGDSDIANLGNFSTTNKTLGVVYSGGASLGLNF